MVGYYDNEKDPAVEIPKSTVEDMVDLDKVKDHHPVQTAPSQQVVVQTNLVELTDNSLMPFGKEHKGKRMNKVPANYLHWMWTNVKAYTPQSDAARVLGYIKRNMSALKMEHPDGVWQRPSELGPV